LDAMQTAATIAIESQREAKAQEQLSLERSKTLDTEIENLRSKKQELVDTINVANHDLATTQSKLSDNSTLLDRQEKEVKSNSSRLTQLESTLKATRDELKTTREELVKATEDLTATVIARKNSAAAIENANDIKKEVESLRSEKAKLTGEISSLAAQRSQLEENLANADSRISVAEKKLADYLSKWNNRDKINQEIDQLLDRVKTLKQTESDTVENISRLNDQSVKQETKVKSLADEIKLAQEQLSELKEEQKKILASIIELQKQRREIDATDKKETPKQEGGNSPNE
jgi:chromosome segregation ATPase